MRDSLVNEIPHIKFKDVSFSALHNIEKAMRSFTEADGLKLSSLAIISG